MERRRHGTEEFRDPVVRHPAFRRRTRHSLCSGHRALRPLVLGAPGPPGAPQGARVGGARHQGHHHLPARRPGRRPRQGSLVRGLPGRELRRRLALAETAGSAAPERSVLAMPRGPLSVLRGSRRERAGDRRRLKVARALALALAAGCAAPRTNVVLVTLDGTRWQEIFGGANRELIENRKETGEIRATQAAFWRDTPEERRRALAPFL